MKNLNLWIVFIVFILLQLPVNAKVSCTIKGQVIDAETKEGVPDVYVYLHSFVHDNPEEYKVFTDDKGFFAFSNKNPGRYSLFYIPLYPYVIYPDQERQMIEWEKSFVVNEGEVLQIRQELEKGGEFNQEPIFLSDNFSEYSWEDFYLDRIDGGKLKKSIYTISHKMFNPRFKRAKNGTKLSGLAPGEYITCSSYKKRPKFYTGDDVEYAGIIRRFNLQKLEQKTLKFDYNSTSKLVFNSIKDSEGNKFHSGSIYVYKEIELMKKTVYYCVWKYSYDPDDILNPIAIEPGKYVILFYLGGELVRPDGKVIEFEYNEFEISIEINEIKHLDFVVSISEKLIPSLADKEFIQ